MNGELLPIAGIRPVPPEVSLLGVADRLPDGIDWRSGIAWRGASCVIGHPWPGICPAAAVASAGKAAAGTPAEPGFRPYTVYVPFSCAWVTPDEQGGMRGDVEAQAEAVTAWAVSRELWAGPANLMEADVVADPSLANPTLMSEATNITVSDAVDPEAAVALLLSEYAGCTQAGGATLHVPLILIPYLMRRALVSQVGGGLRGPLGSRVSPGPGYPGPGPWGPDGAVANAAQVWMMVSGPVEYALGPVQVLPDDEQAAWDRRTNLYRLYGERRAIHRFDPCCVKAIKVDIPDMYPEPS